MKSSENRIFSSSRSSQFAVHDKYNEASLAWAPSEKEWSGKVSFTSPLLTTRSRTEAFFLTCFLRPLLIPQVSGAELSENKDFFE